MAVANRYTSGIESEDEGDPSCARPDEQYATGAQLIRPGNLDLERLLDGARRGS